tara:strand:- start:199 stop:429 length:231 start_codon:yes stop_codon:yes gene_type:complete
MSNNYQKINTNTKNRNTVPEIKVPENAKLNHGSGDNLYDMVNNLRQRLLQLENRVTELSRMCPHNKNEQRNNMYNS